MSYVILFRNPSSGRVGIVSNGDEIEGAELYDSEAAAEAGAKRIPVCQAWPYIVVEAP